MDTKTIVYPNPSDNIVKIETTENLKNILVLNSSGQLIEKTEINIQNKTVDFSKVSNGIYFIKITTTNKTFVQKVIINGH